ncbi:conserved hypothetical protein [Talaromyces stipitatus ATCC 10500]|uniref:Uncharacterized protein n=1 Tax=Talaromyces stipitatus (strain ATCC 10500 / CBS 375.48 / QM 6759 / NRRL 1006) TaxID=441959 RepID=B8MUN6_TALSN|nr:uncharacterized protein TSTA_108850 [Talaromyces stipitatus ATCC 10500]EED11703.1 conserved hypothetical protein [Talaromyces stipitatus ATCC 10500]
MKGPNRSIKTIIPHPTRRYHHAFQNGNSQYKTKAFISSTYSWERARQDTWQEALTMLSKRTDMVECARKATPSVNDILQTIRNTIPFCQTVAISNPSYAWNVPTIQAYSSPTTRNYHTESATSQWKVASTAAAHNVLNQPDADTSLLLVLLCFLNDSILPLDLLSRGTTRRKRWNDSGGIEDVDVLHFGLSSKLASICSTPTRLDETLDKLQSLLAISKITDYTFELDKSLPAAVIGLIPNEFHPFWRLQALIIACRSIPWKYLEHPSSNMELFLPHIRHTLQEGRKHDIFKDMSPEIKADIILSIIEASRFPGMEWKQFAIRQSKEILSDLRDVNVQSYVRSYIAQRESVLRRLTGSTGQSFPPPKSSQYETAPGLFTRKSHSGSGHGAIQWALDCIQREMLEKAAEVLANWEPIHPPSLMETVVLFRKHIIMGNIERHRGNFKKSLEHLMISMEIANGYTNIAFHEDSSDLVCSLADTYLELEDPVAAESCLREEIAQQSTGSATLLKLALAESLFAQYRRSEAEGICIEIEHLPKLLKMEKLRLSIILAKLAHTSAKYDEALRHWTDAMTAISRYNLANGRATRIILLSMYDVLQKARDLDTKIRSESQLKTQEQLEAMKTLAGPTGVFYWIGGLRHWLEFLEFTLETQMDTPGRKAVSLPFLYQAGYRLSPAEPDLCPLSEF